MEGFFTHLAVFWFSVLRMLVCVEEREIKQKKRKLCLKHRHMEIYGNDFFIIEEKGERRELDMVQNTKEMILKHIQDVSEHFDFQHMELLSANAISKEMHISRSLASQYLNELVKEGIIFKINTRPVYFLHRQKIEEQFQLHLKDTEFYDLEDFREYIRRHGKLEQQFAHLIGHDKSLAPLLQQFREIFEYPPYGLPLIVHGESGSGKRTITSLIYKHALSRGTLPEKSRLVWIECSRENSDAILHQLFGSDKEKGRIWGSEALTIVLCNAQYMNSSLQERFSQLLEAAHSSLSWQRRKETPIRLILLTDVAPSLFISERLQRSIPVVLHLPSLQERSVEEREELVMYLIRKEAENMQRRIRVSNIVLRTLVHAGYENNILGLKNTIQKMCAAAMQKGAQEEVLTLHSYDLPEYEMENLEITMGDEVVYMDSESYVKSGESDILLDYFERVLDSFDEERDFSINLKEMEASIHRLYDYLLYKQKAEISHMKGMEVSLTNILDTVVKRRFINLPANFSFIITKLIYFYKQYQSTISKWQSEHSGKLLILKKKLKEALLGETMIVEDITHLIETNLEMKTADILCIMMSVTLHQYNLQLSIRKMFGLIICHGYSTASSIADAVNTLVGNYVFEGIDMPLDITVSQIKEILLERLHRMNNQADVVIMVDMGSLEQIGNGLSSVANRNIGVINNVSTKTALMVGEMLLQGADLKHILAKSTKESMAEYTLVECRKKDRILFTSESGIPTAKRMRELFENSLPQSIPVDCEICDFNQLVSAGNQHEMFTTGNVLFITGTANPHVKNVLFIPLEGIISSNNLEMIRQGLSKYMESEQLEVMVSRLRENFTLQNVVQYLTILNPKVLLDNVTQAIDILQEKMHMRFGGKTLIGIYIHVCCLIERLVTKTSIEDITNPESFEMEHQDFIRYVKESFLHITQHYNIEIPVNETAYLYEFIIADDKKFGDEEFLKKWDKEE